MRDRSNDVQPLAAGRFAETDQSERVEAIAEFARALDDGAEIEVRRRIKIEDQPSRHFGRIRLAVPRMQLERGDLGDGDQSLDGVDLQVRLMIARDFYELEHLRHARHPMTL